MPQPARLDPRDQPLASFIMPACQLFYELIEARTREGGETPYRGFATGSGFGSLATLPAARPRCGPMVYLAEVPRPALRLGLALICLFVAGEAFAANYEFLALENVYGEPPGITVIHPFAIVLRSSRQPFGKLSQGTRGALRNRAILPMRRLRNRPCEGSSHGSGTRGSTASRIRNGRHCAHSRKSRRPPANPRCRRPRQSPTKIYRCRRNAPSWIRITRAFCA